MTEYQIASAIENYVTSNEGVTNFPVSIDQIRDEVDTLRLRMFDEFDSALNYTLPLESWLQELEMKPTSYDADIKATIVKIPEIHMRENGKLALRYCGSNTKKTQYRVVTGNQNIYATHDRFIGKAPLAHYRDGVFTFYGTQLKKVYIEAVFTDPSALSKYGYDYKTTRYPATQRIIDHIIGKTAESYIRTMYRTGIQPNTQTDLVRPNAGS